jgi:large subunit ribosomal protein L5
VIAMTTPRLKQLYQDQVVPAVQTKRGYSNKLQVARLQKIVVNLCVGSHGDKDDLKAAAEDLAVITGQRPVLTMAKKSISNFKLREFVPIGAMVTLRGARMYEFLERLIQVVLPRVRDFRGVPARSFDGRGNYSLGLEEQTLFPEINPDKVKRVQGMDITFVTTARNNEEGRELLQHLGMPFAK